MTRRLNHGDIVVARFPEHVPPGHEQHGARPGIVTGLPEILGRPRFPVILLTPLTTDRGQIWVLQSPRLYPRLPAGTGGLPNDSIVLLDQTRAIGLERVVGYMGSLSKEMYQTIQDRLIQLIPRCFRWVNHI